MSGKLSYKAFQVLFKALKIFKELLHIYVVLKEKLSNLTPGTCVEGTVSVGLS